MRILHLVIEKCGHGCPYFSYIFAPCDAEDHGHWCMRPNKKDGCQDRRLTAQEELEYKKETAGYFPDWCPLDSPENKQ